MSALRSSFTSLSHRTHGALFLGGLALAAALAGCGEDDDSADESGDAGPVSDGIRCGFTSHGDHSEVQALLDALPACELAAPSDQLDFAAGCVEGVCAGMTYPEIVAATGAEGDCEASGLGADADFHCTWRGGGIKTIHADADADGKPDPGDAANVVFVQGDYAGADAQGVGLGMSLRCYLEALGSPPSVLFCDVDGVRRITSLSYDDPLLLVDNTRADRGPEGFAAELDLTRPR